MSKARELANLGNAYSDGALSNRNLIINGAMQVAQRGTSETGKTSAGYYSIDHFKMDIGSAGTWTISQSTTAPDGFAYSFKLDCTAADASLSAGDYCLIQHRLEGQDLQRLQFGTSSAKKVTISFWVRSNKTGTYPFCFFNTDNQRSNGFTYTIDAADTWEYKTHIFDGDTLQGFDNDANSSVQLEWWVAAGTSYTSGTTPTGWQAHDNTDRAAGLDVNLADNTANEFLLTGVMLEIGDTATPFEHRSYGDELARCQRYFHRIGGSTGSGLYDAVGAGVVFSTTSAFINVPLKVQMRAKPSVTFTGTITMHQGVTASNLDNSSFSNYLDKNGGLLGPRKSGGVNLTVGNGLIMYCQNSADIADFDAEL
jgi:hypothetical protein